MSAFSLVFVLAHALAFPRPQVPEGKIDPSTLGSVRTLPTSLKANSLMEARKKTLPPSLTDGGVDEMLQGSEKMGNVKSGGGKVSGSAISFYAGELSPRGMPAWTSAVGVYYTGPTSVGPGSVYFTEAIGVHNVRGFGLHLTGVCAHLLVVELLLEAEEVATPGTRLEALVEGGPGIVQLVRPGRGRVAVFVVAPDPTTHEARLNVDVDPTRRCELRRFTVRPVG